MLIKWRTDGATDLGHGKSLLVSVPRARAASPTNEVRQPNSQSDIADIGSDMHHAK